MGAETMSNGVNGVRVGAAETINGLVAITHENDPTTRPFSSVYAALQLTKSSTKNLPKHFSLALHSRCHACSKLTLW
jgi:hypothetical protein